MVRRIGRALLAILRALGTAWAIVGVTLLLVLACGLAYVEITGLRGTEPDSDDRADHPYRDEAWFAGYRAEYYASLQMQWRPYVYWRRRPMTGQYVNVDSAGIRRTVQPAPTTARPRHVFFLGGSTMWGTGQRDAATIPSLVAAGLVAQGQGDVVVTNYGETGYVFTQELIQLMMELRNGARPDVVVFYDGINDAASSAMSPKCGLPQNETRRAFEFALGRVLTQRTMRDVRSLIRSMSVRLSEKPGGAAGADTAAMAHGIVDCYVRTASLVETLAAGYGFTVLYFWQPTPGVAHKPLTSYEVAAVDTLSSDPRHRILRSLNRRAAASVDSAMGPLAGARFQNMATVFAGDTATVWLDYIGHVTERANGKIAGAMVAPIIGALKAPRAIP